jgi:hypothetical protein
MIKAEKDTTAEQKILVAAKKIFTLKGLMAPGCRTLPMKRVSTKHCCIIFLR